MSHCKIAVAHSSKNGASMTLFNKNSSINFCLLFLLWRPMALFSAFPVPLLASQVKGEGVEK